MRRRTFLSTLVALPLLISVALGQEAAPPPAPSAPLAPAGAQGLLIANAAAGFSGPLEKRGIQALFRGVLQTTPAGQRVLIHLLPPGSTAQIALLDQNLGWSENTFERQIQLVEAQVGRPYFKRQASSAEVLASVAADPGGVGVVSPDTLLTPGVVILWPGATP